MPPGRISLTLSRHFSLSFITSGRSSGLHPVSSYSCCMYVRAGRPAFAWPYAGSIRVHHWWVRPCFSSSVLRVLCGWLYIYIVIHTEFSFYQNSSVWLDTQDASSLERNPADTMSVGYIIPDPSSFSMLVKGFLLIYFYIYVISYQKCSVLEKTCGY